MEERKFGNGIITEFGMALAQNAKAMEKFDAMSTAQKQQVLATARSLHTKEEIRQYLDSLVGWQEGHPPYQL